MNLRLQNIFTVILYLGFSYFIFQGVFQAPVEVNQGEVYRILYLHVPVAITAFLASLVLFIASVATLIGRTDAGLQWQKASVEVGLVFTILTLATGMIWGKPTWGVWWVWDARLTTTLLLALLFAGYLLLFNSLQSQDQRRKICSILGIIIFNNVPIIYKSVDWWRTIHQGHSLLDNGKDPMSPEIKAILVWCIFTMLIYGLWLIYLRQRSIKIKDELDQLTLTEMRT